MAIKKGKRLIKRVYPPGNTSGGSTAAYNVTSSGTGHLIGGKARVAAQTSDEKTGGYILFWLLFPIG